MWIKIRDLIRLIANHTDDYNEKYVTIKFNLNDELPLNKAVEIPIITAVVTTIFHENNQYYPQVFLDECLYKMWNGE